MKVISVTAFVMGMMFLFRLTITSGQDIEQQVEKESYSAINSVCDMVTLCLQNVSTDHDFVHIES